MGLSLSHETVTEEWGRIYQEDCYNFPLELLQQTFLAYIVVWIVPVILGEVDEILTQDQTTWRARVRHQGLVTILSVETKISNNVMLQLQNITRDKLYQVGQTGGPLFLQYAARLLKLGMTVLYCCGPSINYFVTISTRVDLGLFIKKKPLHQLNDIRIRPMT